MSSEDKTKIVSPPDGVGPGTQLNGIYEIDERIAFGGMGEVYRGHNIQTEDPVAIKIVLPEFARDNTILALFRKEASILSHLSHDAIVRYHVFTIDPAIGRPYLAMEFVDGESLADHFKYGPMDAETARRLVARVASGLSAAHEAGVIHRDLSPDNIILPGGNVSKAKIIDFGIAKSATVGGGTLLGGKFAGKYNFVSPEQLGDYGAEVTARSDIYSLGLVFVAVLRGEALDMGGSQVEVIEKRRSMPDIADLDSTLLPLIEAMLQPDPALRPPSMEAIVQWLQALGDSSLRAGAEAGAISGTAANYSSSMPPASMPPQRSKPPEGAIGGSVPPRDQQTIVSSPPTAFGGSQPPWPPSTAPRSESPFGPGPSSPPAAPSYPPSPPDPFATPPKRRSRAGAYVVLILMLLIAGGAAGYLLGLFEPLIGGREIAQQEQTDVDPIAEDETVPEEDVATETPPDAEEDVAVDTPPEGQDQPSDDLASPPTGDEAVLPEEEAEETVAPLDTAAGWIEWLRNYEGGECFYATAVSVSDSAIEVEGFATEAAPFATMLEDFEAAHGVEPDIGVRILEPGQCAVADFLHALRNTSEDRPLLSLSSDIISSGEAIRGTLRNVEGRTTDMLLIDNAGVVYNLEQHLRQEQDEVSFNIKLGLNTTDPVPQVIVALASPNGLDSADVSEPIFAATLFPRILAEIREKNIDASAAIEYFRLGG